MKKLRPILLLSFVFTFFQTANAQCSESGDFVFLTQQELDDFKVAHYACADITLSGSVTIGGTSEICDIHDLSAFWNVTSVTGDFIIRRTSITEFTGASLGLVNVGGELRIANNPMITSLKGLEFLQQTGSLSIQNCAVLQDISALYYNMNNITGGCKISGNPQLQSLYGLNDVTNIGQFFYIIDNSSLTNLDGLNNLESIGWDLLILNNDSLTNLDGINILHTIGSYLHIESNPQLTNLNGLSALQSINGDLLINGNDALADISGLENINPLTITGNGLQIENNPVLSVCNLPNLCEYLRGAGARSITGNGNDCISEQAMTAACDVPCPAGDLTFTTQQQLDEFGITYIHCTDITLHNLTIGPETGGSSDITDLTPLQQITKLTGILDIRNNPELLSLNGLNGITQILGIGSEVQIRNNAQLQNIDGLSNLESIQGAMTISDNPQLQSLGLGSLESVGRPLTISNLSSLTNLDGLYYLHTLGGDLNIINNSQLETISGLISLHTLEGSLKVYDNPGLETVSGLSALQTIGGVYIKNNSQLQNISGLNALQTLEGVLEILNNSQLEAIIGFNSLQSINGYLSIRSNPILEEITGFSSLATVSGNLWIGENPNLSVLSAFGELTGVNGEFWVWETQLQNLDNFSNLTAINGKLALENNPELEEISGLQNIDPATISGGAGLFIANNPNLSFCNLPNFCEYLSDENKPRTISNNLGNCFDEAAVTAACTPCPAPTALTASTLTMESATISWTSDGDLFDIEWGVAGFAQGSGTQDSTTETSYELSGLETETSYDFYVRRDCTASSDGHSDWEKITFQTIGDYSAISLSGFNADIIAEGAQSPSATTSIAIDGTYVLYDQTYSYNNPTLTSYLPANGAFVSEQTPGLPFQLATANGNNALRLDNYYNTQGLPLSFTDPLPAKTVYVLAASGNGSSILDVTLNFEGGSTQQFTGISVNDWFNNEGYAIKGIGRLNRALANLEQSPDNPRLYEIQLPLDEENYEKDITSIKFKKAPSSGSSVLFIMGITIENGILPACLAPENLIASGITATGAGFSWDVVDNASGYEWVVVADGENPDEATPVASGSTPEAGITAFASGLEPETDYDFYVKADCGVEDGTSDWVKADFTTLELCPAPVALSVSDVTTAGASFSWDVVDNASGYEWVVVADGENPDEATPVVSGDATDTEISVSGLEQNTAYDFYIRADCGVEDGTSDWVKADFTTLELCPAPVNLSVSDITMSSATINWTSMGDLFNIEWGVAGFVQGSGTQDTIMATSYDLSGLEIGTSYDFYIRQDCSASSDGESGWKKYTFSTNNYCIPVAVASSENYGIYINSFTTTGGITDINNTNSGFSANGYGNFLADYSASQAAGENLSFSAVPGAETYSKGLRIWVDWNNDGIFANDASETVYISPSAIKETHNGSFEIPDTVVAGNYRMRVMIKYFTITFDPCETGFFGETEDYTLTVLPDLSGSCDNYTIWNGTVWSNGEPDLSKRAIIDGNLVLNADLTACELEVTANGHLEIPSGKTFTVNGQVINNSGEENFIVESDGNLIQVEDVENTGEITVRRNSTPMMRLDYALWSSPVDGQGIHAFSPETVASRIYTYEGEDSYQLVPDLEADFIAGKGYMFRAPNNWNITTDANDGNPVAYPGEFKGVPFNGDISIAVHAGSYTSVGNPYPSNIKLGDNPSNPENDTFLNANPEVGTVYFWTNTYGADGSGGYTGNNWATYTLAGGTSAGFGSGGTTPVPFVAPGQGFIISSTESGTSVSFNNTMRTSEEAIFFKNEEEEPARFWLNLDGANEESYNQILIGYMNGATLGIDNQIDGKMFGYEGSAIYNLIDDASTGSTTRFTIQGRPLPFEASDVVPLGFRAIESGKFEISLSNYEGIFSEGQITIFIKDKTLHQIHNLMESAYEFESEAGEFNDRFEIIYEDEGTMGTDDQTSNTIRIYTDNDYIVVDSETEKILSVELYDLSGRNLYRDEKVNANHYRVKSLSKSIVVVKAQAENGEIVTKKVVNK